MGPGDTLAGHRGKAGTGVVGKRSQDREAWRAGAPQDNQGWGEDSCPQTPRNSSREAWPQVLWSPPRGKRENSQPWGDSSPESAWGCPTCCRKLKSEAGRGIHDPFLWSVGSAGQRGPESGAGWYRVGGWAWGFWLEAALGQSRRWRRGGGGDGCQSRDLGLRLFLRSKWKGLLTDLGSPRRSPQVGTGGGAVGRCGVCPDPPLSIPPLKPL